MAERLYAEHPDVYDALYAEKAYDDEVEFVAACAPDGAERVLVVGCGTGEHSRRLVEHGFDVTGVDKHEAMVERARTKSDATFRVGALPDLPVDGEFDVVFLPFTVINYLPPDELVAGLRACVGRLSEDGVLVFDHHSFGDWAGNPPALRTHERPEGDYARLIQVASQGGQRYRWNSLVFTPQGDFFVDVHELTDHDPAYLVGALESMDLSVSIYADYGGDALDGPGDEFLLVFAAEV